MWLIKSYLTVLLWVFMVSSVNAKTLRDPTLPSKGFASSAVSQHAPQGLTLNSIVSSGNSAHAVINNQILSVGDSIQGLRITQITANYVALSDGRKLTMFKAITER